MSVTAVEKVTVARERVVELAATIEGLHAAMVEVLGVEHPLVGYLEQRIDDDRLISEVISPYSSDEDGVWERDRDVVDIQVRATEIEAEVLEYVMRPQPPTDYAFEARVAQLRSHATRMREGGTIDIDFETGERRS